MFDDMCPTCREEYLEMKGIAAEQSSYETRKYKEFTQDRAKRLYEDLMLQYLKNGKNEIDADAKAKSIIKKQCSIRGLPFWDWL
jgi:hypothetical protein